jgi:site-specific DNA-cytosine methylase
MTSPAAKLAALVENSNLMAFSLKLFRCLALSHTIQRVISTSNGPISPQLIKHGKDEWRFTSNQPARRFSYREAARLQGFSSGFTFADTPAGSLNMRDTVVGNAVSPPLFEAVTTALANIWD